MSGRCLGMKPENILAVDRDDVGYINSWSITVARYRDDRLAGDAMPGGLQRPRSNNTVRLELALLGHMFNVALKRVGLSGAASERERSPAFQTNHDVFAPRRSVA